MDKTINITYLPKSDLCYLNKKAIKLKFNRSLNQSMLEALPEENRSPIHFSLPVNDCNLIRANIEIIEGIKAWLDILIDDFNGLPSIEIPNPNA